MFDVRTHIRDPKSGKVIMKQPYRLFVTQGPTGEPMQLFERPVKSGIFYNPDGSLNEEHSKEGLARQKAAEAEASKTAEQREAEELQEARELLRRHEAKQRALKAAEAGKAQQEGR